MKEIRGVVSIIFCTFVKICRALYARLAFPSGQRPAGVPRPGDSRGRGSLAAGLPRRGAPSLPGSLAASPSARGGCEIASRVEVTLADAPHTLTSRPADKRYVVWPTLWTQGRDTLSS